MDVGLGVVLTTDHHIKESDTVCVMLQTCERYCSEAH